MATTIYTYLHNDDLNGSRIVSMDDCMCKLYNIMRDDSDFMKDFERDLQSPALYILINKEKSKAYVGETDDFIKRISQHLIKKDFWSEVMVFLATNEDTLSKTEVQYLEFLALEKAKQVKSYDLSENTQSGKIPHMNVMQKGKTDKFFKYVQFLAKFVGCDIFEPKPSVVLKTSLTSAKPKIEPVPIDLTSQDLKGTVKLSLNGEGKYTKREMVLQIVKEYVRQFPDSTFEELRATFNRDYLQRFAQNEFLQQDIEKARNWKELGEDHPHYFTNEKDILVSGDGVQFVVCVEWDRSNIINVLGIAKALGWTFEIVK